MRNRTWGYGMELIKDLDRVEEHVYLKVKQLIIASRNAVTEEPRNLMSGINILKKLRSTIYEDLNQIQHEGMILRAARLLESNCLAGKEVEWHWNPRQTGTAEEPDLRGIVAGRIVVSAEITTSERPIGSIDQRMTTTLDNLSKMPGKKIYFVCTDSMEKRARTKVKQAAYQIEVGRI
jgi:hypothetical protein